MPTGILLCYGPVNIFDREKYFLYRAFSNYTISKVHEMINSSDQGHTWGNDMDWNLIGEYTPD